MARLRRDGAGTVKEAIIIGIGMARLRRNGARTVKRSYLRHMNGQAEKGWS